MKNVDFPLRDDIIKELPHILLTMYRTLSILVSVLMLCGVFAYLYFTKEVPLQSPLPPVPNNEVVNIPIVSPEENQYIEKMKIEEEKQIEIRNQSINDIELANAAITLANAENCKGIISEITRTMCEERSYEALAIKEKNISNCESIKNTDKKSICIDKVYIIQAKEKRDTVICDMISDSGLRSQCTSQVEMQKYNYGQTTSSGEAVPLDCKDFSSTSVSSQCTSDTQKKEDYSLLSEAMQGGESGSCNTIRDEKIQNDCYDGVHFSDAKNTGSLKECDKILSMELKSQCISLISTLSDAKNFQKAIQLQGINYCEEITSTTLRANCMDRIRLNQIIQSKAIEQCSTLSDPALEKTCNNSLGTN